MSETAGRASDRALRVAFSSLWALLAVLSSPHAGAQTPRDVRQVTQVPKPTDIAQVTQVAKPPRTMPPLYGKMYDAAVLELRKLDVAVDLKRGPGPSDVPEGAVFNQDPPAGAPVGSRVTLFVSTGPAVTPEQPVSPPVDVTPREPPQPVETTPREPSSTTPPPGTPVETPPERPPTAVAMPNLIGKTLPEAQAVYEIKQYRVRLLVSKKTGNSYLEEGRIYEQWPREGEPIQRRALVHLSKGPARMPRLLGMTVEEAQQTLYPLGARGTPDSGPSTYPEGRIYDQRPREGERLVRTPLLYVSNGESPSPLPKPPQPNASNANQAGPTPDSQAKKDAEPKKPVPQPDKPVPESGGGPAVAGHNKPPDDKQGGGNEKIPPTPPPPVKLMPNVIGMTLDDARNALGDAGLDGQIVVERRWWLTWSNRVVWQMPESNTPLVSGPPPSVTLWMSLSIAWILAVTGAATLGSAAAAKVLWPNLRVSLDLSTAMASWNAEPSVTPEIEVRVTREPGVPPEIWSVPILKEERYE